MSIKEKIKTGNVQRADIEEIKRKYESTKKELQEITYQYQELLNLAFDGIFIHRNGQLLYVNESGAKLAGVSDPAELIGKSVMDFVHPDYRQLVRERIKSTGRGSGAGFLEEKIIRLDGSEIDVETAGIPIIFEGEPARQAFVRDISQRKTAEKRLKESEEKFRKLAETAFEGIVIFQEGRILEPSDDYATMFGYRPEELVGKKLAGLVVKNCRRELLAKITSGFEARYEITCLRKDSSTFPAEMCMKTIQYLGKSAKIAAIRDISDRNRFERDIKQKLKFESTIFELSSLFVGNFDLDETIDRALAKIGAYSDASRAYLFRFRENGRFIDNSNEWCNWGVTPEKNNLQNLPTAMFPWWMEKLNHDQIISIKDVSQMLPEADSEKKILQAQSIQSVLIFPLKVNDEQFGFVGLDNVREAVEWEEEHAALLKILSEILRNAFEREQVEVALRESEERYRTLFETMAQGIIYQDPNGRIVRINPAAEKILGITQEELEVRDILASDWKVMREDGDEFPEDKHPLMAALLTGKEINNTVLKLLNPKKGEYRWLNINAVPQFKAGSDKPFRIYTIIRDITDGKKTEEKIFNHQRQLQTLASRLSLAEERERRRIATGIHNRIGQILAITKIKLGTLKKSAAETEYEKSLSELYDLIDVTIREARSLTFELSPPVLYELGFTPAVEWLAEKTEAEYGVNIFVRGEKKPFSLGEDLKVILFQGVRELLLNALRHGDPENVKIFIKKVFNGLQVTVTDDGKGFDVEMAMEYSHQTEGFGLFDLRERLGHLGGGLLLESNLGKGSKITIIAPLPEDEEQ